MVGEGVVVSTPDVFLESAGKAVCDGICNARTYAYGGHGGTCKRKAPAGGYCWQHEAVRTTLEADEPPLPTTAPRRPTDLPGAPCETYGGNTP